MALLLRTERDGNRGSEGSKMQISSNAFAHNGLIPAKYTCDGQDTSPPCHGLGCPEGQRVWCSSSTTQTHLIRRHRT